MSLINKNVYSDLQQMSSINKENEIYTVKIEYFVTHFSNL